MATNIKGYTRLGNTEVCGNIRFKGQNINIDTNTITLNTAGTSTGTTGINIYRGSTPPAKLIFDEADDKFKIGIDADLKSIATEDFVSNKIANITGDITNITDTVNELDSCITNASHGQILKVDANNNTVFADDNFKDIHVVDNTNDETYYKNASVIDMSDIFNNWIRITHFDLDKYNSWGYNDGNKFKTGQNRTDDGSQNIRNQWTFNSANNTIANNGNNSIYSCFISNAKYSTWQIRTRIQSRDSDDDFFSIVIGFITDKNGVQHTLSIMRQYQPTWSNCHYRFILVYDFCNSTEKIIVDNTSKDESKYLVLNKYYNEMFVNKKEKSIVCKTSNCTTDINNLQIEEKWTITWTFPSSKPSTWTQEMYDNIKAMFESPCQIGFGTYSFDSYFVILESVGLFEDNKIYNLATNKLYDYKDNSWIELGKVSDNIPYRSFLYSKELGKLYFYYGPNDYVQIICNNTTSIATKSVNTLSYKSLDMYPIGSVYTSTINTDPKELFGGEWKTIDNNNNTAIYMWERIS